MSQPATTTDRREKHVRLAEDLVDMLGGIWFHEGTNIADILDPLVRPAITKKYKSLPAEVRAAIESRRTSRAARVEAKS